MNHSHSISLAECFLSIPIDIAEPLFECSQNPHSMKGLLICHRSDAELCCFLACP